MCRETPVLCHQNVCTMTSIQAIDEIHLSSLWKFQTTFVLYVCLATPIFNLKYLEIFACGENLNLEQDNGIYYGS